MKNNLWKNWFLLLLGLWIMILPETGFPEEIKSFLFVASGFLVIILAFVMARQNPNDSEKKPS